MLFKQVNWDVSKKPPHSVFIFSVDSKQCVKYYPLFVAPNHIQRTIIPRTYLGIFFLRRGRGGCLFDKGANFENIFVHIGNLMRGIKYPEWRQKFESLSPKKLARLEEQFPFRLRSTRNFQINFQPEFLPQTRKKSAF